MDPHQPPNRPANRISLVDLATEIAVRKRSPLQLPPALGHVSFTLVAQLVGVSARFLQPGAAGRLGLEEALMAAVPVERSGPLSDHGLLQRYLMTPQTAGDAFYQAACEFYLGLYAGLAGLVLDPIEGFRLPGALGVVGALAGLIKGLGGLAARPVVGLVDGSSKGLQGIGLLFLGKRGIQGKLVRRVRPPGAAADDPLSRALRARADGAGGREAAARAALVASWAAAIGLLAPALAGEGVVDVLAARHNRVVVLTSAHVVYLKAEPARPATPSAAAAAQQQQQQQGAAAGGGGGGTTAGSMVYQLRCPA
ncbi:hypothetical protein MNEG_16588 [Monoraphidium neglectum]|uniref:Vacuolar protein sorting-associated protein 13 DH-like domain-containing protein n=1 Tax=Monoraphidium neglectum TaxID=145388 RepID=A0A0D2LMV9_9CHLO|nr:hypothetical protein MNEG_16588 [Monoraphidium neglectum]KIY91376.1 hypothetical protein MNEG_16588 [Monoraphidium neglectum]|eukprot:XP_013890396.1 hypothetical protein MNEG_16588 [Monoraphidium neglectum]